MNSTIVHTIVEKPVKVVPTGLRPVIFGGTWRLIGRKNTQNVTLDAKHSFDPDDRDGSEINEFK